MVPFNDLVGKRRHHVFDSFEVRVASTQSGESDHHRWSHPRGILRCDSGLAEDPTTDSIPVRKRVVCDRRMLYSWHPLLFHPLRHHLGPAISASENNPNRAPSRSRFSSLPLHDVWDDHGYILNRRDHAPLAHCSGYSYQVVAALRRLATARDVFLDELIDTRRSVDRSRTSD